MRSLRWSRLVSSSVSCASLSCCSNFFFFASVAASFHLSFHLFAT
nr:MAG TPA: hypothetical protein [Caudoviricetes sp.]